MLLQWKKNEWSKWSLNAFLFYINEAHIREPTVSFISTWNVITPPYPFVGEILEQVSSSYERKIASMKLTEIHRRTRDGRTLSDHVRVIPLWKRPFYNVVKKRDRGRIKKKKEDRNRANTKQIEPWRSLRPDAGDRVAAALLKRVDLI